MTNSSWSNQEGFPEQVIFEFCFKRTLHPLTHHCGLGALKQQACGLKSFTQDKWLQGGLAGVSSGGESGGDSGKVEEEGEW